MPHSYRTDAERVGDDIEAMVRSFGFRTTHEGRALGELLVESTVEGIRERSIERQCDGEGNAWPENSDNPPGGGYRSRKERLYGTELTNVRTGQMLSIESLKGRVTIADDRVEIAYGTGRPPDGGSTGYIAEQDKAMTDVEKAYFAARQGRAFFELDHRLREQNFRIVTDALGAHMANTGR